MLCKSLSPSFSIVCYQSFVKKIQTTHHQNVYNTNRKQRNKCPKISTYLSDESSAFLPKIRLKTYLHWLLVNSYTSHIESKCVPWDKSKNFLQPGNLFPLFSPFPCFPLSHISASAFHLELHSTTENAGHLTCGAQMSQF